jgi:hypothetical protein
MTLQGLHHSPNPRAKTTLTLDQFVRTFYGDWLSFALRLKAIQNKDTADAMRKGVRVLRDNLLIGHPEPNTEMAWVRIIEDYLHGSQDFLKRSNS